MFANQSEEIVWNWDTNTDSTTNCLKHRVFSYEFIIRHPSYHDTVPFPHTKATQYWAPKPSALIFTWRFFLWQRKWLNVKKDLSSSPVDGLAMNSFQTSSCCVFQVRYYKLHKQNVSDGLAHCADLAATVTGAKVRCTCSDEHCITQIGPKAKNRLLCTEASMMSPSCYLIP